MNEDLDLAHETIKQLSEAPDTQLSKEMCEHLKTLHGKPKEEVADGLLYVLDMSAQGSLASEFTMNVLNMVWNNLGGKVNEDFSNCPWRKDL